MFCSGCGQAVVPGQPVCQQCGRPIAPPVPPVPGMNFLVDAYAGKIRTLGVFWLVYGGLSLILGFMGMAFAHAFMSHWGMWNHGPWGQNEFPFGNWFWPAIWQFAWFTLLVRAGLAFAAGWGLMERAPWARLVALIAAFFSILKFPFGTAIGIFTLVLLLGYRNNMLYSELQHRPMMY